MLGLTRTAAIMVKEVRQLARDRLTFGMIVGIPIMQICLFGYAINTDVRGLRAAFVDLADTHLSRQLVADIEATQVASFVSRLSDVVALQQAIRSGRAKIGVYIPADFERRMLDSARPAAQLLIDGSDPTIVSIAQRLGDAALLRPTLGGSAPARLLEIRNYFNPERRSAVQIVPGLIGVILTLTMVLFTAVAVVRERERGNFELLITTPVRNIELMVGKITPYVVIGLIQVSIVLLVGSVLFRVPIVGRIVDLYLAALLFIAATLGLGLTISTIAQSQFQAMQLTFFVFLPSILLSGFMFPFDGMPAVAQWIGWLLPLTHFMELVRGIMLRGAEIGDLTRSVAALLVFFCLAMTVAVLRFRKRLD
jgi:ABC-2 type transport system permease protein